MEVNSRIIQEKIQKPEQFSGPLITFVLIFSFSLLLLFLGSSDFIKSVAASYDNLSPDALQTQSHEKTVFVQPIFTEAAYSNDGFHYYHSKKCYSDCLTAHIPRNYTGSFASSKESNSVLSKQRFSHITDIDIDKNPQILKKYDKVILLHNEYVTRNEFNAITQHPHVIYLYPNALFAEIKVNYDNDTISLVRGHGYPHKSIQNGFGWEFDNSKFEYDVACHKWHFYDIDNGKMLSCYPEKRIYFDQSLLQAIATS